MNDLIERQRAELARLCRASGALRLDAFGSVLREDFDEATSDVDLLVEFDNDMAPGAHAAAYFALKAGLELLFGRPVDLVTSSGLENPFFRQRIEAERQTLYAR